MKIEKQNELNLLLKKKQKFVNEAITNIQKGDYERAAFLFRIESGLDNQIQDIFEAIIPKEEVQVDVEITNSSTYEDVKTEEEEER